MYHKYQLSNFLENTDLDNFAIDTSKLAITLSFHLTNLEEIVDQMYEEGNTEPLQNLVILGDLVKNAIQGALEKRKYKGWYRLIKNVEVEKDLYDRYGYLETRTFKFAKGSYLKNLQMSLDVADEVDYVHITIPEDAVEKIDYDPSESTYYNSELDSLCYIDGGVKTKDIVYYG